LRLAEEVLQFAAQHQEHVVASGVRLRAGQIGVITLLPLDRIGDAFQAGAAHVSRIDETHRIAKALECPLVHPLCAHHRAQSHSRIFRWKVGKLYAWVAIAQRVCFRGAAS
jgi:hypothetical protein